jgi:hypothetical protein
MHGQVMLCQSEEMGVGDLGRRRVSFQRSGDPAPARFAQKRGRLEVGSHGGQVLRFQSRDQSRGAGNDGRSHHEEPFFGNCGQMLLGGEGVNSLNSQNDKSYY